MRQSMYAYVVLLSQHVSGTNMPIFRSTNVVYLPPLGGHTWDAAWVVLHRASWSEHYSEDVVRLATSSEPCASWSEHCSEDVARLATSSEPCAAWSEHYSEDVARLATSSEPCAAQPRRRPRYGHLRAEDIQYLYS
jgi:3-methyladenine DNA glycosylase AlkC